MTDFVDKLNIVIVEGEGGKIGLQVLGNEDVEEKFLNLRKLVTGGNARATLITLNFDGLNVECKTKTKMLPEIVDG